MPRIIHLSEHSNDKKAKIAAFELLHAMIIYMIGKSTQIAIPFAKIYEHIFPCVYRLAVDVEIIARQLFEPLSKQLVRWFARSCSYEHPETMALIDSLVECVCNSNSSALRNLSSDCIGEFCKYLILYNPNPLANFKSVIRRVEALSNHPQIDKRKGAVLCFKRILGFISMNDLLVDKFLLEIAHMVFLTTKISANKASDEISKICKSTLVDLKVLIEGKIEIVKKTNEKRSFHKNIFEFLE